MAFEPWEKIYMIQLVYGGEPVSYAFDRENQPIRERTKEAALREALREYPNHEGNFKVLEYKYVGHEEVSDKEANASLLTPDKGGGKA